MSALVEGFNERVYINGRDLRPSEISVCPRCGYTRQRNFTNPRNTLCHDCRHIKTIHVEDDLHDGQWVRVGLTWRWTQAIKPMSAEDMAWCEKNAAEHKARRPVIYYRTRKQVAA